MFETEKQGQEQNIKTIKVDLTELIPFISSYIQTAIVEIKAFPIGIYIKRIQPIGQPSKLIATINNEAELDNFILENEALLRAIELNYNRLNLLRRAKREGKLDQDWIIEIIVANIKGKRINPDDVYYRERINLTGQESYNSETDNYFRELERALLSKETLNESNPISKLTLEDVIKIKEQYGIDLTKALKSEYYEDVEEDYEEDLKELKSEEISQNQISQPQPQQQSTGFNILETMKLVVEGIKTLKEISKEISNEPNNKNQSQNTT